MSVAGLSFVLSTKTASAAPAGLAVKISQVSLAQALKASTGLALISQACLTRLNIGLVSTAAVIGVIILLIPGRAADADRKP